MKNRSRRASLALKQAVLTPLVFILSLAIQTAEVRANPELDKQYALETVGYLRSWDNVDGLFADYVSSAYKDYFATQSRFRQIDLSKADSIIQGSKLPYNKVIDDAEILGQIARSLKAESIIRTKIYKEGPTYKFVIDWLHSSRMDLITNETFSLNEPHDGKAFGLGDVKGALQKALDRMIGKLPFVANVTGRDNQSITVNIGASSSLGKGDTLVLATIDEVKKHPLLKAIVDWRLTPTGKAVVEESDEGIAFAKITEEESGRQISRYQKVTQIIPKPADKDSPQTVIESPAEARARELEKLPTLGYGSGGLWLGSLSRQYSSQNGTVGKSGSGVFFGAKAEGQLWLTREYFAELGLAVGSSGYSQKDIKTGLPSPDVGGVSVNQVRLDFGYTYFTTPDFFGPKAWVKFGYRSMSYSQIADASELTGGMSYKGLFLGVGGELPIRDQWGAALSLDFGLLTKGEETVQTSGSINSATDVGFFVGGYYRWTNRLTIRAGIDVTASGADFANGASVTHRIITLAPSLLYYF